MTRTVTALCMAAMVGLVTVGRAQQPDTRGRGTLSLTGCVDRANDGTYQLRNARMSPVEQDKTAGPPQTTAGATGTSGSTSAARAEAGDAPSLWILKSSTDLAPHVGHSVQITGRMSAPAGAGGTDTATTSDPTTTATGARMKKPGEEARSVDVQSVRMISRACE